VSIAWAGNQACPVARTAAWAQRWRPPNSAHVTACLIRITMTEPPDPTQLAAAVLGFQAVLSMTGLDQFATIWPDETIVTDTDLNRLADRWTAQHPWM